MMMIIMMIPFSCFLLPTFFTIYNDNDNDNEVIIIIIVVVIIIIIIIIIPIRHDALLPKLSE